jgi:hypothetical protein
MKRVVILFACLLGISALFLLRGGPQVKPGSRADITTSKETATSSGNRAHDVLWRASERERSQPLARTLGSEPCGTVVRTFFQGREE